MSHEYKDFLFGGRRMRAARTPLIVTGVALVAVLAVEAGWRYAVVAPRERARVAEWTITGPPCPELTAEAYAALKSPARKRLEFGATFARQYGHVECVYLGERSLRVDGVYPVCQFSAPAVLVVTTPKATSYFQPGVGHSATVSVQNGVARCVMAGSFKG